MLATGAVIHPASLSHFLSRYNLELKTDFIWIFMRRICTKTVHNIEARGKPYGWRNYLQMKIKPMKLAIAS